ncbi:MAG: T9SS type A sorting domain-containing protein [Ignavibacteriales bacterium]|nr:T9SS type A sorting domain-containing protein [Ignavibacteriales bacterium]
MMLNNNDQLFSQSDNQNLTKKKNNIKRENLFSEKKKVIKGFVKNDSPNKFVEYKRSLMTRSGETKPGYRPNYIYEEVAKSIQQKKLTKATNVLSWIDRGPGNVSGRTRGLIVDVSDPSGNTWFAGSVGGGIWKTTDKGFHWENKTVDLPNLGTTVLIQSPSNPDIIFCGTGEGFYNADAVNGSGIFKSTDHGNSWNQLLSTANFDFYCVNRMAIDPTNPDVVLACTNEGPNGSVNPPSIYRSTDGGATWTRVYQSTSRVQDLKADPNNFLILYAAIYGKGVVKSTDGGLTWQNSSEGLKVGGRVEIAVSPTDPNYIYASAESADSSALFISTDAAQNWQTVYVKDGTSKDWLNGQGWYDNTIAVHPYKKGVVFFAGIDVWKAEVAPSQTALGITSVDQENLASFISFTNWIGCFNNTGVGIGKDFFNSSQFDSSGFQLTQSDYVSVEVRFGIGVSQKAHRFVVAANGGYEYKDFVVVPFQVWDITNNKQLMVSFRDNLNDGKFDLKSANQSKEYIAIHSILYNADAADPQVALTNGIIYKNIYAIHPYKPFGTVWNPDNLPTSTLRINYGTTLLPPLADFFNVTDGYGYYQKPYVHVDHHNLVMIPKDAPTQSFWILNGNDGGVALSTNGGTTWREALSGGYNTTQFYGADKKPSASEYIGGTQDNGTYQSPANVNADKSTAYRLVIGGDGFDAIWNYNNSNLLVGSSQYNNIRRSSDGGHNWTVATNGLGVAGSDSGCFISKIANSNTDPDIIYTTGASGVWRSENFGQNWFKCGVKQSDWAFNGLSTPIAISITDPGIIWAGTFYSKESSNLVLSKDGGIVFNLVSPYSGVTLGNIAGIDTHPTDANTAYLTFGIADAPKILRTTNLGQSWQDITGFGSGSVSTNGFPNVVTYCVVVMPFNTNIIWAGTEIGLFESTDNGISWHYTNNGLPAVCIWDMKIVDDQVILATHGRGIFSVTLNELNGYKPPVVTLSPLLVNTVEDLNGVLNCAVKLRSVYDSTLVFINGTKKIKILNTSVADTVVKFPGLLPGIISVQIASYKNEKPYHTFKKYVMIYDYKQPVVSYVNDFNSNSQDFFGNDFNITTLPGFQSSAIHSLHPYNTQVDYYYTLLVPITVANSNAFIEYDDIAIVEPGETGSVFGETQFYDYVVIEGSKDGLDWLPIEDGYDCRFNPNWQNIWNSNLTPNSSNFVHHKINLLNKFNGGDKILIRLRMFSDPYIVGWGWAMDNLSIQAGAVGVENENTIPTQFSLSQNYPNPFNPSTKIKYTVPSSLSFVTLKVFDVLGKEVATLVNKEIPLGGTAGNFEVEFNASKYNLSSGFYFYVLKSDGIKISKKMCLLK